MRSVVAAVTTAAVGCEHEDSSVASHETDSCGVGSAVSVEGVHVDWPKEAAVSTAVELISAVLSMVPAAEWTPWWSTLQPQSGTVRGVGLAGGGGADTLRQLRVCDRLSC